MPTFDPDTLPSLTLARFPHLEGAAITVESLAQDGSDRVYYRLKIEPPAESDAARETMIVMRFGTDRAENLSFTPVTLLLKDIGVACPDIYSHDDERHLIWLQDLGGSDLYTLRHEPWETVRRPLCEAALREAARIHAVTADGFARSAAADGFSLQPPFDADLYRWEQDYFFENFVANFSDIDPAAAAAIRTGPSLATMIADLAALPKTLVHRDFQSRNVLVRDGRVYLIDYQGMRLGLPEYDLASLLYDPYVEIPGEGRETLLQYYAALRSDAPPAAEANDRFLKCAAQRLMQALGAYGFLGLVKQKRHFLDSIPQAVQNLQTIVSSLPSLKPLEPLLNLKQPQENT